MYWSDVTRAADRYGDPLSVQYPPIGDLLREAVAAAEMGWADADADVAAWIARTLRRLRLYAAGDELTGEEFLVTPDDAIAAYAENRVPPLRGVLELNRRRLVNSIVRLAARDGADNRELMRRLERDGFGRSRWHRENIARTESSHLYNYGRTARYHASPFVTGYRFDAILDSRTTEVCENLHGHLFEKDGVGACQPPLHFQCRSNLTPVFADEEATFERPEDLFTDEARPLPGFGKLDMEALPVERNLSETYPSLSGQQRDALGGLLRDLRLAA
jgi:SPP1 gp7 family putative phage head morphogenesis protein